MSETEESIAESRGSNIMDNNKSEDSGDWCTIAQKKTKKKKKQRPVPLKDFFGDSNPSSQVKAMVYSCFTNLTLEVIHS
jgi:hypothetical protein